MTILLAYVIFVAPNNIRQRSESKKTIAALRSLPAHRVYVAVENFTRDRKASGGTLPSAVSLGELTSGGYLRLEEVAALRNMDVTFGVGVDETSPQQILVSVRLSDYRDVILLADGSIQTVCRMTGTENADHRLVSPR